MTPAKIVEVAIALVFDRAAGTLLICKRKAETVYGGYWEFPGGKCDAGEAPEACACREVEEETGLRVKALREMPVIEHIYPHAHVRLHPFVCELTGGTLELRQVADALWIEPRQVREFKFPEANEGLLERAVGGLEAMLG